MRRPGRVADVWRRILRPVLLVALAVLVDLVVWGGVHVTRWGSQFPNWLIPAATVAVYSTLLLHRRFLYQVFAVQLVFALGGILVPTYQPFAGLLAIIHLISRVASPLRAKVVLLVSSVAF